MKINIYAIVKASNDHYDRILQDFIQNSSKYASLQFFPIFNKNISKAQNISEHEAKKSYTQAYEKYMSGYNIALDVTGKKVDSFDMAALLQNHSTINFFIGGAYGFENAFLQKCDTFISLSNLTLAHKIATVVLAEQLFRGLCINNNHPYHK